jgi:hypothetical protein
MNTGGNANDGLMVVAPIVVLVIVTIYLAGGPTDAFEFLNDAVRTIVYHMDNVVRALL